MQATQIKPGMTVEVPEGVGEVLVVDHARETVLVQGSQPEQQWAVECDDVTISEQLHIGCDSYY